MKGAQVFLGHPWLQGKAGVGASRRAAPQTIGQRCEMNAGHHALAMRPFEVDAAVSRMQLEEGSTLEQAARQPDAVARRVGTDE